MNLARFDWRIILALATSSMLMQQAFSYVCQIVIPFLADRLAERGYKVALPEPRGIGQSNGKMEDVR